MFDNFFSPLHKHFSVKLYFSLFIKIPVWFGSTTVVERRLIEHYITYKQPVRFIALSFN